MKRVYYMLRTNKRQNFPFQSRRAEPCGNSGTRQLADEGNKARFSPLRCMYSTYSTYSDAYENSDRVERKAIQNRKGLDWVVFLTVIQLLQGRAGIMNMITQILVPTTVV